LREALQTADYVLNDGIGVALAARWLGGESFPENLNGSDFTTRLLHMAAREGWSVFLLGGRGGVAWEAGERLRESIPRLQIVGCRHGYHYDSAADVDAIRRAKPDVLLVAMGNPHQEVWLHQHWKALPSIRLAVGVGAYLDFQAGVVPRAPRWMNDCGIEWVYRLAREPFRLGRRYVIGNPVFVLRVLLAGRSGSEARTARRHGLRDMT
jgi:N-acetylglucosaminyldiphosphoundecaprenol N-acetyl-beta-D-mannosaminyltransferase